jgi:hypothetical protein
MHIELLSDTQKEVMRLLTQVQQGFYLGGGTAAALHIGHRYSDNLNLFSPVKKLNKIRIKQKVSQMPCRQCLLFEDVDQIHINMNGIKVAFLHYPFPVKHLLKIRYSLHVAPLLSIAAMKAYALERNARWKNYVDLYYIIKHFFSIEEIAAEAQIMYGQLFSEKLFREQLAYHADINYTEKINFTENFSADPEEIKTFLIDKSLTWGKH